MNDPLAPLLADGVIDEIVGRLKSGKEADVWLVRVQGEVAAAKVYKARHVRSFRNDSAYREGRQVRNTRTQRAMDKGSRFGQAASEDAWKAKESDALHRLHAAGVRVPRPVIFYEGVLVMELVLGGDGHAAPRLIDAHLGPEHAAAIYTELRGAAIAMLSADLVHGDLSPYNVLAGLEGPVVIDFPQVVDAAANSQAEKFFLRDLENVRRFCAALDPSLHLAESDGREIWRAYVRRELTPGFVPTGRMPDAPRARSDGGGGGGGSGGGGGGGHRHRRPEGRPAAQASPPQHPRGGPPRGVPVAAGRPAQQPPPQQHAQQRPQGQRPAQGPPRPQQGPQRPPQGQQRPPPQVQQRPPQGQRPPQQQQRPQQSPQRPAQGQRPQAPRPQPRAAAAPEVIRVQRITPASPAGAPRQGGHGHGGQGNGGHGGGHRRRGHR